MILFITNSIYSQELDGLVKVKSIKLLVSTIEDVASILGEPLEKERLSYGKYYDLQDGRINVIYETGVCVTKIENGIKEVNGWNVPEWTVISVSFTPKERISPKKLNITFNGFEKEEIGDNVGAVAYRNDQLGIYYEVYKGKIETISFYPSNQFDYLHCK